jgi:predicted DNA-binding transcriptional regulator AlpA
MSIATLTSDELRASIEANGGLLGQGDVALRLGVSREMARRFALRDDFPQPLVRVTIPGGRAVPLWLGADVDSWQRRRKERLKKRQQRGTRPDRMRGPRSSTTAAD